MNVFEIIKERLRKEVDIPSNYAAYSLVVSDKSINSVLDEVENEYGNDWISVGERLPDESGEYLTWVQYDGKEFTSIDEIDCDGIIKVWNCSSDYKILAWQPLPGKYIPKTVSSKPLIKDMTQFEQLEKIESVLNEKQSSEVKMGEEELIVAKVFLDDLEQRNGTCNEIETLRKTVKVYEELQNMTDVLESNVHSDYVKNVIGTFTDYEKYKYHIYEQTLRHLKEILGREENE